MYSAPVSPTLTIHTDGSVLSNPGFGGWAFIIIDHLGRVIDTKTGSASHTTSQRMELTAILEAFKALPAGTPAVLFTDSQLAVRGLNEMLPTWEANGYKNAKGKPLSNYDLWRELSRHLSSLRSDTDNGLSIQWTPAHAGPTLNQTCDYLSRAEAEKLRLSFGRV